MPGMVLGMEYSLVSETSSLPGGVQFSELNGEEAMNI